MERKDRIGYSIGFVVLIGLGVWAVADPGAMEGYAAVGRHAFLKGALADYWGRGLGFALIGLGVLALIGLRQAD